ncbi:hypothetical protein [Roseospira marina]|nr:hypothetical protein [Roseospira marina]MBB4314366.1 hypothetical protein [Roseospira marina]MBB5087526.1 hypothetical protein [Roseospira marina]
MDRRTTQGTPMRNTTLAWVLGAVGLAVYLSMVIKITLYGF